MAKKAYSPDPKAETIKRIQRTEAYAEKVRQLFAATVNEILALNKSVPTLDEGVMYSFDGDNMRIQKKVEALLRQLHSTTTTAIKKGITLEWEKANDACDKLISSCFGKEVLSSPEFSAWNNRNMAAMNAFTNRTENGLNLSKRIWQSVQQLRDEMEIAMTVAIGEGDSAQSISRKVRQYLNDPDLMFRRFRFKKGEDEQGKPIYGRKWKKRIKDEKTGKYRWIDYDRSDYKTGSGVYKSSAKNAMRVARSETNIAYRRADNERWQQMDFVLGQRIQLSKNHPKKDICDKLAGDYPKDFVFDGWHVQCFCFATPILIDEDEMAKVTEAFLKGEKYTPRGKQITEYPANFKNWVRDNKENILASRDRGTEPYFIRNNSAAIDQILDPKPKELTIAEKAALRHEARTPEQEAAIRNAWAERQKKHQQIKTSEIFNNELQSLQPQIDRIKQIRKQLGVNSAELNTALRTGDINRIKEVVASAQKWVDTFAESLAKEKRISLTDAVSASTPKIVASANKPQATAPAKSSTAIMKEPSIQAKTPVSPRQYDGIDVLDGLNALTDAQFKILLRKGWGGINLGEFICDDPKAYLRYLNGEMNRGQFMQMIEKSLAKYTGGNYEPLPIPHAVIASKNMNISASEKRQINSHDDGGYISTGNAFKINTCLRKKIDYFRGQRWTPDDDKTVKALDNVIAKNKIATDITVFRKVGIDWLQRIAGSAMPSKLTEAFKIAKTTIGKTPADMGYMSASFHPKLNVFADRNIVLHIRVKKNTPFYMTTNYEESEIIFGRGTKIKINDVKLNNGEIIVYCDML